MKATYTSIFAIAFAIGAYALSQAALLVTTDRATRFRILNRTDRYLTSLKAVVS
jgi:hypothetical protein